MFPHDVPRVQQRHRASYDEHRHRNDGAPDSRPVEANQVSPFPRQSSLPFLSPTRVSTRLWTRSWLPGALQPKSTSRAIDFGQHGPSAKVLVRRQRCERAHTRMSADPHGRRVSLRKAEVCKGPLDRADLSFDSASLGCLDVLGLVKTVPLSRGPIWSWPV